MARSGDAHVIREFLGSAHIFTSAVKDVVEKRLLEEVAGKQLTHVQFRLLMMVALADARTITDVGLFLRVSNAAASKAVDKLVRRKLLRRAEGRPDRREIRLSLTASSRRLLEAYEDKKGRVLAKTFGHARATDLKRVTSLLDRFSAALVDGHAKPDEVCLQCGIYFRESCLVRRLVNRSCFYLRNKSRRGAAHAPHHDAPSMEKSKPR